MTWKVKIEVTPEGEKFIAIPDEVIKLVGWKDDQEVEITALPSGAILIRPVSS